VVVAYKRIVNGDFGGETDNPADPASTLAELPEGSVEDLGPLGLSSGVKSGDFGGEFGGPVDVPDCVEDLGPLGLPSGINGDFGGEFGDPVDVPLPSSPDRR
jgi:hypothetical protein